MIDRGSMITEESTKKETAELEKQIKNYRVMYVLIGSYCSLYRLFFACYGLYLQKVHHSDDFKDKMIITAYSVTIFNLPWVLKPIFGYIGDLFSPFGYRAKGYIRIITVCNSGLLLGFIRYGRHENISYFLFMFVLFSSFLDSIAQGMTTITVTMELRLEEKKNPFVEFRCKEGSEIMEVDRLEYSNQATTLLSKKKVWEPSMVKNFAIYVAATYASYCVWLFFGFYFSLLDLQQQHEGRVISSSQEDVKNLSVFCTVASALLFGSTFCLSELKRTSWWSPNLRKKPFKVVMKGIFQSRNTYLIFVLGLLSINPSNFFWEFAYEFFVTNSFKLHQVTNVVYLSSPILVSGLLSFLILLYMTKVWKYKMTAWYLKMVVVITLLNLTNHFLMSICNSQSWMKSQMVLYLYAVVAFFSMDIVTAIIKVCLVDKFLLKSPKGYEVFYINMVLSLLSLTRGVGKFLHSLETAWFDVSVKDTKKIRATVYINSAFVATATVLYWLYRPKMKNGQKSGVLETEGHSDYDLLHSSYNLEDWKEVDDPEVEQKQAFKKRTMSAGNTISMRT